MTTIPAFDRIASSLAAGEPLPAGTIHELSATPDILQLGMLADTLRRRLHANRATFVRVAFCPFDRSFTEAVQPAAREVRITGAPDTLSIAVSAVESAKAVAGARTVAGFSWADVDRLAGDGGGVPRVLAELRAAGLDALGSLALDTTDLAAAVERLAGAGFDRLRLSTNKAPAHARTALFLEAAHLQERFGCIQCIDPLSAPIEPFRPTTGYEDTRMVAIARLAAPGVPSIQVDWQRYGPKLAQVALTFGADDLYGVSPADAAPEGRRRAPLEEIRRNIEAAGFEPVERDGAFAAVS